VRGGKVKMCRVKMRHLQVEEMDRAARGLPYH
jgi:hypothetical protein